MNSITAVKDPVCGMDVDANDPAAVQLEAAEAKRIAQISDQAADAATAGTEMCRDLAIGGWPRKWPGCRLRPRRCSELE